jgi:hypothetical protein
MFFMFVSISLKMSLYGNRTKSRLLPRPWCKSQMLIMVLVLSDTLV